MITRAWKAMSLKSGSFYFCRQNLQALKVEGNKRDVASRR